LPVTQWSYKTEPGIKRIVPMAQDFRAAFGLGPDDKHITTVDSDDVALAAIQGLHRAGQEKDARIAALERTVEQLKRAVDALTAKQLTVVQNKTDAGLPVAALPTRCCWRLTHRSLHEPTNGRLPQIRAGIVGPRDRRSRAVQCSFRATGGIPMKRRIEWVVAILLLAWINSGAAQTSKPSPLLAIDQHRATVVERIVTEWGDRLVVSGAGVTREQLREMLFAMRADQLLAASLAGTLDGLRNVLASAPLQDSPVRTKALGDAADDVVYTPVTPCRLVETRGTFAAVYQGGGAFTPNQIRDYTAQGGNGVCLSQLPNGLNPSALQLQVFGIPISSAANGDVEILPQGSTFGSTATLVYLGNILFTSASTTARINLANNQIGVQVRGGGANVAIDVVGYFAAPNGSGRYFVQGGNTFGNMGRIGTLDNQPFEIAVNNQRAMRYEPDAISPNVIGGSPANFAFNAVRGATIAGGGVYAGDTDPNYAFESPNVVTDHYGAIGGGYANVAGNYNATLTDAPFATVGGGRLNVSSASASTIGGGRENIASANNATVGGGYANHATNEDSTVGGGFSNTASGFASTVGGGESNTASDVYGTVAGGISNTAYGTYGTVAGGINNTAGQWGTVGGGASNTANGNFSTVAGGESNSAAGSLSFAAGFHANANQAGCFVWGDLSTTNEVNCGGVANRFVVRAEGGIYMFAGNDGSNSQGHYTGVVLPPGAQAWVAASDRAGKDNLSPVDARDVLRKIAAMPIATWNWKSQDTSIRHMGPMAQDFRAAFGLGETEKGISTVDADGVALAAIQGLHQMVQEKDARIAALETALLELKRIVDALATKQ
jgi:hypothetical protein